MKCSMYKSEVKWKVLGSYRCAFLETECPGCGDLGDFMISGKTYSKLKKRKASEEVINALHS